MKKNAALFFLICTALILFSQSIEKKPGELERQKEILKFGLESEITALIDGFIKTKDNFFADDIFAVFNKTQNSAVREKIVQYFTILKDTRLASYAVAVLEDPYDTKSALVNTIFQYITELQIKDALPAIAEIVKSDADAYFYGAVTALGRLGGPEEAQLLTEYISLDYPLAQKQAIVRSLGLLQAIETWPVLVEIAENPDENAYMRVYAAEAIGSMKKEESIPVLIKLYEETDPLVRAASITGLSNFNDDISISIILEALKDNHYRVRMAAVAGAEKQLLKEAIPTLVYRAKNDPESSVRYKCFDVLAVIGGSDALEFLLSIVENPKANDASRIKAASSLLKSQFDSGIKAVISAAEETLKDDKNKKLRYELGKELTKYDNSSLAEICAKYMASSDALTKGIGLDIFSKNFFSTVMPLVTSISENEKEGVNQRKAKTILERGKLK